MCVRLYVIRFLLIYHFSPPRSGKKSHVWRTGALVVRSSILHHHTAAKTDSHCRNSKILTDFEAGMCQNQTVTSQMLFRDLSPAPVESGSGACQKMVLAQGKGLRLAQNEGQQKKTACKNRNMMVANGHLHIFRNFMVAALETFSLKTLLIVTKATNCMTLHQSSLLPGCYSS